MAKRKKSGSHINQLLFVIVLLLLACIVTILYSQMKPQQKQDTLPPVQTTPSQPENTLSAEEQAAAEAQAAAQAEALRKHRERKDGFYTILVSGVDDGNGGSDTNILLAVDTAMGCVYGASIPRDTKAIIDGSAHKINFAYNLGGMEKLSEVVTDQLGIPVDYTVLVNLRGFRALVDAIGGIDFYVPVDMDYDDPRQNLEIHFSKGMQHLSGAEALKVVRFRHNNDGTGYGSEDIGRMETQQKFLKAVAKKMLSLSSLDKLDDYVKIFNTYVETDLTTGNLAWLGGQIVRMGADNVSFSTLPNEWINPYIYLVEDDLLELVNAHLNPFVEDRVPTDLNLPR